MKTTNTPIALLRSTFSTMGQYTEILKPFIVLTFINLVILEILYFIPRYPLANFCSPIIEKIWGMQYLHYPANLILLPKLFYYGQMFIYFFIGTFLLGAVSHMIACADRDAKISFINSVKNIAWSYIYILFAAILSFGVFQGFSALYEILIRRAAKIHSTQGFFFLIKKVVIIGAPYIQFLAGILITLLLVYVIPIIVIEKHKFIKAIIGNFKFLFKTFWTSFIIVTIPSLFYLPVLILRNNTPYLAAKTFPEMQILTIIVGVIVSILINIFIATATTTLYLQHKER